MSLFSILGGGGYSNVNAARCWTYATACAIGTEVGLEIPEHHSLPE